MDKISVGRSLVRDQIERAITQLTEQEPPINQDAPNGMAPQWKEYFDYLNTLEQNGRIRVVGDYVGTLDSLSCSVIANLLMEAFPELEWEEARRIIYAWLHSRHNQPQESRTRARVQETEPPINTDAPPHAYDNDPLACEMMCEADCEQEAQYAQTEPEDITIRLDNATRAEYEELLRALHSYGVGPDDVALTGWFPETGPTQTVEFEIPAEDVAPILDFLRQHYSRGDDLGIERGRH